MLLKFRPGELIVVYPCPASVCINGSGYLTKMAAMAINSQNPLKVFFSRTRMIMILKFGMEH